jgi:hypothetical protein
MISLFGLVDAENVPVEVVHYIAAALVIIYFIGASSVPAETSSHASAEVEPLNGAAPASSTATSSMVVRRGPPRSSSGLLKWLYILAASTFVRRHR